MERENKHGTKAESPPSALRTYPDWGGHSLTMPSRCTVQDCRAL